MNRRAQGVTLVELLVVLAVLAVLLGIAAPSFSGLIREHRLATAANGLLQGLLYARAEAIKRSERVTVCVSSSGDACTDEDAWQHGWVVFVDSDDSGVLEPGERVLKVAAAQIDRMTIIGNTLVRRYVSYNGEGLTQQVGGGLQMGTILLCHDGVGRRLVINSVGRPRIADGSCEAA